ncbi:MAG: hypothetical protein KGL56_12260 [Alphaproteobacteria bacterium]|nr:hypothetical protein [Alphaproteobacteria bacterium]MDE2163887.1 hypothetical protein [Alphaproteobacteria bacterium]MDE2500953.1 hypothetical protein [Alphaproteobacteria bacterium]
MRHLQPIRTSSHRIASTVIGVVIGAGIIAGSTAAPDAHTLDIANRVSKFEKFYTDAKALDEAARWSLWKKEYGIAAVPPTPEGEALARKQLDAAWPRYAALMPQLPALEKNAEATAHKLFAGVNTLYATAGVPIHTRVVFFVGQFDGNEFTVPAMNGQPPTVVMPVENPMLAVQLAHEMSHSVHFQLAGVKNSFGAPIGETVFLEGLAMHANKALVPGLPDTAYTELNNEPGWLARCTAHKTAVIKGILPYLDKAGPDVATKFTFGKGTTGMDRELYCAGWFAIGKMLASGKTFPQLARIPESKMIDAVRAAMKG